MQFSFRQWTARTVSLLLYAAAVSLPVMAQDAPPSADSFVLSTSPKVNFGAWPQLAVTPGSTTFIQFNLSSLPANATISKATLRLYVDAITGAGAVDVYEVNTPWTEGSLNFTNAPTPGVSATGNKPVAISSANVNQFVLIDVTGLVQDWVNGTVANHGIALKLTSTAGGFSFDSKESPLTSHEPELEVSVAATGAQGPQGPAGPQGTQGPPGPAGPQGVSGNLIPGSPLYVQNGTTTQAGASFNIDGSGTVGGTLSGQNVNSATGYQIGGVTELNADGKVNIMIGPSAGNGAITGGNSQLIGDSAGTALTSGNADVFIGSNAGAATTTGNGDVYVGWKSGQAATTAPFNTFVGAQSGTTTTTGGGNLFAGFSAGLFNTTGQNNTFAGSNAGYHNTTGGNNLYLGFNSGLANTTGSNNIYLAHDGVSAEDNTIRIGAGQTAAFIAGIYGSAVSTGQPVYVDSSGHLGTGGGSSVFSFNGRNGAVLPSAGDYDLSQITGVVSPAQLTGTYTQPLTFNNAANAYSGASLSVTGTVAGGAINSTAGYQINGATTFNQNSVNVTMIGAGAGNANITGADSQVIGHNAGAALTSGNADVFVGSGAGSQTTTGNGDVYLGVSSGGSATTAAYNTFVGGQTGFFTTTGGSNLFAGFNAGVSNTTGYNNTFVGADAGFGNTTGNNNVYLGYNTGFGNATGINNIYLGNFGVDGESNTIRIGDGNQQSAFVAGVYGVTSGSGVPVYINSNGQLGTLTSSQKYKEDIHDLGDVTSALMKLRPVTFYYKREYDKGERALQYGLIAEEVAKVFPELVAYNPDGTPYTVRYQYLSSILLSEVQKQYRKAQAQAELIDAQKERIDALEHRLSRIESLVGGQQAASNENAEAAERR